MAEDEAKVLNFPGDAGQVVGDGAHAIPGVDEHRQAVGCGPRIDLHGRRSVQREVLRPRMKLYPAVSPVAATLVLVLPRTVRVEPHERDEPFGGRPVGVPNPFVGHPKVGALLGIVERKDHRAVDPIVVEIPQQADEVKLTPIAIPTHMRVRVPDRRRLQHAGGQATQVGVRIHRHARLRHGRDLKVALVRNPVCRHHLIVVAPTQRRSGQVHIGVDLAQERQEFAAPVPGVQRSNVERGVQVEVPLGTMTADLEVSYRLAARSRSSRGSQRHTNHQAAADQEPHPPIKAGEGAARSLAESLTKQAFANTKVEIEQLAAQFDKRQALDLRWTIIGLFISAVRGSVTGRDPQAPSTLWIVIIRQHWRNSMLHSASCLELVLLVTLRRYVIPSAPGNHHTNQTRRNDRHNRHRRGPVAPTASRPPRTLTQPEVGA